MPVGAAPPPPPITSIVLLFEFQSLGTVQLVPEVRKTTFTGFDCDPIRRKLRIEPVPPVKEPKSRIERA
jgi:hypothetical protein